MTIDPNDDPDVSPSPDSAPADMASSAGDETEKPPEQPPGGDERPYDPDAPYELAEGKERVRVEPEDSPIRALDETDIQPDAPAADETAEREKLELLVEKKNPPGTAKRVCMLLSEHFGVRQRGGTLVQLWGGEPGSPVVTRELSPGDIASLIHEVAQPYRVNKGRSGSFREEIALPDRVAKFCLSSRIVATLPPLNGIAYAPLVAQDGTIRDFDGYDPVSGMYCHNPLAVTVPNRATQSAAEAALRRLRKRFGTFPFADSVRVKEDGSDESVVDIDQPPGADESICLTALATVVCRPSLPLVPGLLVTAPYLSGAGTGKGLLVKRLSTVGYGLLPIAMTTGHNTEEFDKRLTAALMTAAPIIFLDNVNATELRSNLLASAITENPAQVRRMGSSTLVPINPATFICVTGNGLSVTEDLRRRFLEVQLNPGLESPEARSFKGDFLAETMRDRSEILSDVLTIVMWGLQQGNDLPRGRPMGSFEQWSRMCRDPLLALNCKDAVEEMAKRHVGGTERSEIAELFEVWWRHHGNREMKAKDLHSDVWGLLAPFGEPRQRVAIKLKRLGGAVCNGFRLWQIEMAGNWSAYRYRLECQNPTIHQQGPLPEGGQPKRRLK